MRWKEWTLLPILICTAQHRAKHFTTAVQDREVDWSTTTRTGSIEESMWPYPTFKPISWEKYYYSQDHEKHVSLTSGLAAGITLGVFIAVFFLVFGCRAYSQRSEHLRRLSSRSEESRTHSHRRLSVSDFFACSNLPTAPPPPYEIAIGMPSQLEPPPFTETPELNSRTFAAHPA